VNEKGFLLVETIFAMLLTTVAIVIILMIYTNGYSSYIKQTDKIDVQENMRIAMNRMVRDIRQASEIPTITNSDNSPLGAKDKITFVKWEYNSDGDLVQKEICYYYDSIDREIQKDVKDLGHNPLASNIKSVLFDYSSSEKSVTITIVGNRGKSGDITLSTKVNLRLI